MHINRFDLQIGLVTVAPKRGFEPPTYRLTAGCSTVELLRNKELFRSDLLSQAVSRQVPSALKGLTAVFGMDTGVSPSLLPRNILNSLKTAQ